MGHKAGRAALGLSCGACFERLAGVFANRGASVMSDNCPDYVWQLSVFMPDCSPYLCAKYRNSLKFVLRASLLLFSEGNACTKYRNESEFVLRANMCRCIHLHIYMDARVMYTGTCIGERGAVAWHRRRKIRSPAATDQALRGARPKGSPRA